MYEQIVIGVDGSEEAQRAAQEGLQMARFFDGDVTGVSVVEQHPLGVTETPPEHEYIESHRSQALAALEAEATDHEISVTTQLTEGSPSTQIQQCVRDVGGDMVVLGQQGLTGIKRRLLGGVTEAVIEQSDVPVLVVPDADGQQPRIQSGLRILVPTDGSENAGAALPHATRIAEALDATTHVLTVVDVQAAGGLFDAGGLESQFIERLVETGQSTIDGVVAEIETSSDEQAVIGAVERTTPTAGAADTICDYVTENAIDLVVMGSRGRSSVKRKLLGSVAVSVLRTIDVPTLVVPQPHRER